MADTLSQISDKLSYPICFVILLTPYKRSNINEILGKFSDNFSAKERHCFMRTSEKSSENMQILLCNALFYFYVISAAINL